jgi:hypothetical protein
MICPPPHPDTLLAAFWLGYLACLVSVGGAWWLLARVGGA